MKKILIKFLFTFLAIIMLTIMYIPVAIADDGDMDVEVIVNGFGGGPPLKGVKVYLFNNTKTTGSDGKVVFKVKGPPPQSVSELMQFSDKNNNSYGRVTTNFILSPDTKYMIVMLNNPGYYDMSIQYNLDTDVIIITTEITQSNDLHVVSIDFIQNPNANNQTQPQNPQPQQNQPGYDPDMPGEVDPGFNSGMSPVTLGLIIAAAILLIVVIIIIVRNSVKKKRE